MIVGVLLLPVVAMGGGSRAQVAPDEEAAVSTEIIQIHGMSLSTVIDDSGGAGHQVHKAWLEGATDGAHESGGAAEVRGERQFHIMQPQFPGQGWKHKNVGRYPEYLPPELAGVLPADDYEDTASRLNGKVEALEARLKSLMGSRCLLLILALGLLTPLGLATPRILAHLDNSTAVVALAPAAGNSSNSSLPTLAALGEACARHADCATDNCVGRLCEPCVNCLPEVVVSVSAEHEPMETDDWLLLGVFAGGCVLTQLAALLWARCVPEAACSPALAMAHSAGVRTGWRRSVLGRTTGWS